MGDTGDIGEGPRERILLLALDAFKTTGIPYTVGCTGEEFAILPDNGGFELWLRT